MSTPTDRALARRDRLLKEGLCDRCGHRPARHGLRSCQPCADRMAMNQKLLRPGRGYRRPHSCSKCGGVGHTARSCDASGKGLVNDECIRCTSKREPGKLHCEGHEATLAELERERDRWPGLEDDV